MTNNPDLKKLSRLAKHISKGYHSLSAAIEDEDMETIEKCEDTLGRLYYLYNSYVRRYHTRFD